MPIKNSLFKVNLLSFLLLCAVANTQKTTVDNEQFDIEVIHARKLSKVQLSTNVLLRSEKLKTVFVKLKMSSVDGKKRYFDINKFSLIEDFNNLRIRPLTISYQVLTAYQGFYRLSLKPLNFKSFDIKHKPEIKDSFHDNNFDGYQPLEVPINYGGLRKPKNIVSYFEPQEFKTKKLNFFFPFPKNINKGILYYGNEKIAELNFK